MQCKRERRDCEQALPDPGVPRFVKPGLIEPEYNDIYGDVMDARLDGDYDMAFKVEPTAGREKLADARRFVERVSRYLQDEGWL